MTEAVTNLKNWLLKQANVIYVIADTEKDNIGSHRVLEKTGAEIYKETEELFFGDFLQVNPAIFQIIIKCSSIKRCCTFFKKEVYFFQ
ncbi:GNAT family N-acetyltransferase [Solibacillus sp. FSL K6-1781]|uniref:GNAT family N-acetyltransferase n=1 Tax=Solibacillus sp. FSL K6-1781 TaxID=2921474 RepID=UPI003159E487